MDNETLAFTPAMQLAELIRHEAALAGRTDDRAAGAHRGAEPASQRFAYLAADAGDGRRASAPKRR